MESVDCVVIGAGVIGLACARALAQAGREVLVVEREASFGQGISSRNSEVIHAGLYYPPGSLKATLCRQGRDQLYDYCAGRGIGHARIGKLVVAAKPDQVAALEAIRRRAEANGVVDLRWLSREQISALEPALDCHAGLLSPSTGIVDSHGLMLGLLADVQGYGGLLACHSRVSAGSVTDAATGGGISLKIHSGIDTGLLELRARSVINAAGLDAPAVAHTLSGLPQHALPRTWFARGSYFSYSSKVPFSHLVYPVPEPGGLGVHLTLDLAGGGKFGPDVEWVDSPDYSVDPARADNFYAAIRRWWPAVECDRLVPGYAGVRPKLAGPGMGDSDFRIDGPAVHRVPGLVNLFGIESPGLTACMAIGGYVAGLI